MALSRFAGADLIVTGALKLALFNQISPISRSDYQHAILPGTRKPRKIIEYSHFPSGRMVANLAWWSDRFVVFAMRVGVHDIVRCRLAVVGRSGAYFTIRIAVHVVRGLRCAAMPGGPREPQPTSNASGVWNFVSAPRLHPMKANVLTLQAGASPNPIFVAPYAQSATRVHWLAKPAR